MKPARFTYLRPTTLEEALFMLAEHGDDAKIISGGQSLVPMLNMRLSTPNYLIDISRIDELNYIREEDECIVIGAGVRQVEAQKSPLILENCPILAEAIGYVGNRQTRNVGTVVGSVAHADPSAEIPCVLSLLRGEIVIVSSEEEKLVSPEEFFLTYMLTTLEPNELIKEIRLPKLASTTGYAFLEKYRRTGDFALVEVAATLDLDEKDQIKGARVAVGGASPVPMVLEKVENELIGKKVDMHLFKQVGKMAKDYLEPESDIHASSEYRAHLASVLIVRALEQAVNRAGKGRDL